MSIRRLPETLVNRIAAGEVVERPAAALKELVENAIDAGSRRISVRIADGGIARIEVEDDGSGMTPADMALALERHATSKLPDDAIEAVTTLGFRGEALPSIASVARLTLESRMPGADGWRRVVDNGAVVAEGPAALAKGTRVLVEDLFARVPARRKFLRSGRSEDAATLDVVKRLAMANPEVGFTLEHDGRRVLDVQAGQDRLARVAALTSRDLAGNSIGVDLDRGDVHLGGVISLPTYNRGISDHQYLFVNGRPVNTAAYGNGGWLYDAEQYDGFGNNVLSISPGNLAQAITPTSATDPAVRAPSVNEVSRAKDLATVSTYSGDGTELLATLGPTHPIHTAGGTLIDGRQSVTNTYDEGAPGSGGPYRLLTTKCHQREEPERYQL
mgnify:CR=1 FL=1